MFQRKPIPRSQQLVFLDADDDLGTIRSKLEASSAEEVFLVIPRRSAVLRTPLEFRILARVANELSSETILVTEDSSRRRLANQEGFRTRRSLRSLKPLMVEPGKRPPRFVIPDWVPIPTIGSLATFVVVLALLAAGIMVVVPVMHVTVVPQSTSVDRALDITVDPAVQSEDATQGVLPGTLLNRHEDVTATLPVDEASVGANKSGGTVNLTNRRGAPFTVPRGGTVATASGVQFSTNQDAPLPPNVVTRVPITASDPGTDGNVDAGAINGFVTAGMDRIDVTNPTATTGGTDRTARVVTDDLQQQLRDQLTSQLRQQGLQDLKASAGQDHTLPDVAVSLKTDNEVYDQGVGAESATLTGHLSGTASGTEFDNEAFNTLVGDMIVTSAGTNLRLAATPEIQPPTVVGTDGQKIKLRAQATGVVEASIDANGIEQALRGRSAQQARQYLAALTGLASAPSVNLTPGWAPLAFRIEVDVQTPK